MRKPVIALSGKGQLVLKSGNSETAIAKPAATSNTAFLVVDCSGSMAGDKIAQARLGALDFARQAIDTGYAVGLIRFASMARVLLAPTRDARSMETEVQRLQPTDATDLAAAIQTATRELSVVRGGRFIVLVTDGVPDSKAAALAAAQDAKRRGIEIMAVGTGDADHGFLTQLVTRQSTALSVPASQLASGIAAVARLLPGRAQSDRNNR